MINLRNIILSGGSGGGGGIVLPDGTGIDLSKYAEKTELDKVEKKVSANTEKVEELESSVKKLNELFGSGVEGYVRVSGVSDPAFNYRSYKHEAGMESVFDSIKPCLIGNNYTGNIGKILHVLNVFNWEQTEDGHACKIDGTDGDVMVTNTRTIYAITGHVTIGAIKYDVFLRSYEPFNWQGHGAEAIPPTGISPSYTVAHNDGDATRMHSVYNPDWNGSFSAQQGMIGAFVPSQASDGVITEEYDATASWFGGAGGLSTTNLPLYTGEQYAKNMNEDNNASIPYYNRTANAEEFWFGHMLAEGGTWDAHNPNKMGSGFCSNDAATADTYWDESNSQARNGFRYKKSNGTWGYYALSSNANFGYGASGDNLYKACMINSWRTPWRCMEQQRVMMYAIENNIPELTWFVFEGCRYKWRHVDGLAGPSQGAMTCVVWKYFASKLVQNCVEPGTSNDVSGNRCEFLISSALYRGVITDVSPSWWTSGLIFSEDENGGYEAYMQRDQSQLIISETGDKNIDDAFMFEKSYKHVGTYANGSGYRKDFNNEAIMLPDTDANKSGAALHTYVGGYNYFTGTKAAAGKKTSRGFRRGYYAYFSSLSPLFVIATFAPSYSSANYAFGTVVRVIE